MDRFDKDELKRLARGRWKEIFSALCGLSSEALDGRHHPCPKCGGDDRFRMVNEDEGALLCNQCFATKNGDGIAAVGWLLDLDFQHAMEKIGQYLGMEPVKPKSRKRKIDPAAKLEFVDWNDALAALWCLKKQPIKPESLQKVGAKQAIYDKKFKVIAIPVWSGTPENVVGWNLYNITGGTLPKWEGKGKPPSQVKVKLTYGSNSGLIGFVESKPAKVYKTEGPTDLLALISLEPGASCICNANGAKENPARSFRWLPDQVNGADIFVIHDCDKPGQDGATMVKDRPGWANWFAGHCPESTVKNIVLPYAIAETHGKDIRDWAAEGNGLSELEEIEQETSLITAAESEESEVWEADDDPHRLARVNLSQYKKSCDGRLVFWRDEWWKYKAGKYRKIDSGELRAKVSITIRKEFERCWLEEKSTDQPVKKVTIGLVRNVINAMSSVCSIPSSVEMPSWLPTRKRRNYLSFTNGILDLDAVLNGGDLDESLVNHSPDWFSTFRLNYKWDPTADCQKWLKYLDDVMEHDDERIALLQEWAGYLLTSQNNHQKFLVLEGEGQNGKTVFFAAMTAMLGEDNVSHVAMESFGGRFDLGATLGKAANISGDVGEIDQLAEGILKQFTGGDCMQFDRKNLQPIQARPTAKLMAAWNQRPRIKDKSDGLWRRLLLVPFRAKVKEKDRIYGMDSAEWWIDSGESPGILMWAIAGLGRLQKNRRFTKCQLSEDMIEDFKLDSNPAAEFFNEYLEANNEGSIESKKLYEMYQHWCKNVNAKPVGNRKFGKELRRKFPDIDKVRVRDRNSLEWHYKKIIFTTDEIFDKEVFDADLF